MEGKLGKKKIEKRKPCSRSGHCVVAVLAVCAVIADASDQPFLPPRRAPQDTAPANQSPPIRPSPSPLFPPAAWAALGIFREAH